MQTPREVRRMAFADRKPARPGGQKPRGAALVESLVGLMLFAASLALLHGTIESLVPGSVASSSRPASSPASEEFRSGQTLKPGELPFALGARYDHDDSLHRSFSPVVRYTLKARLDPTTHEVEGQGSIEWTNRSSEPARGVYLHLYLNAFKNNQTLFLRAPFGGSRTGRRASDWGHIDVTTFRLRGGADLWKGAEKHTPGDPADETDVYVPLPEPIAPEASVTFDMAFRSKLPTIVERTGYVGTFHMVAQWFPKLARREQSGTWAHFPFHPHSEFYADFGAYDVTLDVPSNFLVGATGTRVEDRVAKGRRVVRHRIEGVHDFAWTAWDGFVEQHGSAAGVAVTLLRPKGHEKNAEVTLAAVRHGLESYGRDYGRYPYPILTVVHPPEDARGADGMEYPTLITTGGPWYAGYVSTFIERVTLHELAHQWFYGLVATDERRFPFLDEGVTSFAESVAMRELFGNASGIRIFGLSVDGDAYARALAASASHHDLVSRSAPEFSGFRDLGALVYARTPTILHTLGNVYGERALRRALGRYARKYRYSHPEPEHLLGAVLELLGPDAEAALRTALFDGGWVDYVAHASMSAPVTKRAGVFDEKGGRETVPRDFDEPTGSFRNRALLYRHGTLRFPVDVELRFESGERLRKAWDGRSAWVAIDHDSTSPLSAVQIDPEGKISLDQNLLNNGARASASFPARSLERSIYATQLLGGVLGP